MKIRKFLRITHRDIGYFFVALTVIYSVSGIAVNHTRDWNPNYVVERKEVKLDIPSDSNLTTEALVEFVTKQLNIEAKYLSEFKSSPAEIDLFYELTTVRLNLETGNAVVEATKNRPVLRSFNFLHLNVPKEIWTWIADIFALSLIFLAFSGMFMIKGKKGFSGRGKWFVGLGLLLPIVFLLIYF